MPCSRSVVRPEPVQQPAHVRLASRRGAPAGLRRRDRLAQLAATHRGRLAGEGRARRLLDLYLHQLVAHVGVRFAPGPIDTQDKGLVVVGVHTPEFPLRARCRERPSRREGHARRLPDRARTATTRSGRRSRTTTGPPCTSRTRTAGSGTTTLGRADTQSARWSSSACCVRPAATASQTMSRRSHRNGYEAQADWTNLESPESYLGYEQGRSFGSPERAELDEPRTYTEPDTLRLNQWALGGEWTIERRACVLNRPDGRIAFRFHARDVHLVMGPRLRGGSVPFRVLVDGDPPGDAHGLDVGEEGQGTVDEQRLLPADSPARSDRRPDLRDRLRRARRRGLRVHVRLGPPSRLTGRGWSQPRTTPTDRRAVVRSSRWRFAGGRSGSSPSGSPPDAESPRRIARPNSSAVRASAGRRHSSDSEHARSAAARRGGRPGARAVTTRAGVDSARAPRAKALAVDGFLMATEGCSST